MDGLIFKLDELKKRVKELKKRRRALERVLGRKGYSLKNIKKNVYVYVWECEGGRVRWKCLGNVSKVGLPEGGSSALEEEIKKIDQTLKEVEKLLDEALKLLP
jgi:chaperonin cofactor prefoldin